MYRYTVDNAITYTSEDFVLFRESPFACWMERLTLENPDHGIPADTDGQLPGNSMERQDDIADTLRTEGRNVVLVDWDIEEARRRSATLDAMRQGADFIVNGQLALGPLSGSANLLMRTSGYSELGTYLYVPCDTQGKTDLHSAFRLCFLADLLHSLQGQLPPQMLIIRGGSDVVPLETEDHIYHYRAVKQRFMNAMREFRKHRMPDPAESSHFGRWSDCAHEVLKQRALSGEHEVDELIEDQFEAEQETVTQEVTAAEGAAVSVAGAESPVAAQTHEILPTPTSVAGDARRADEVQVRSDVGSTLAEQAGQLAPTSFRQTTPSRVPGHTPNLARVMSTSPESGGRRIGDRIPERDAAPGAELDVALENLEFIGSNLRSPDFSEPSKVKPGIDTAAPLGTPLYEPLGEPGPTDSVEGFSFPDQGESLDSLSSGRQDEQDAASQSDTAIGDAEAPIELPATSRPGTHPLDSVGFHSVDDDVSVVDMDAGSPAAAPAAEPSSSRPAPRFGWDALDEEPDREAATQEENGDDKENAEGEENTTVFSNSLITNDRYLD